MGSYKELCSHYDYCQNQEYQKLYAEYERTMSMSKKERMEAGLDEFPRCV